MKSILAGTALALSLSTAVFAASHTEAPFYQDTLATGDIYASTLEGMRVYVPEAPLGEGFAYAPGMEAEWDDIGEVNSIILNVDGSVKAVILGIGGFLGIGEKDVAVPMDRLQFVAEADDAGDFFIVLETTREALEGAAAYDVNQQPMMAGGVTRPMAGAASTEQAMAEKPEGDDAMMQTTETVEVEEPVESDTQPPAQPGMLVPVEREGYAPVESLDLTADMLEGTRVYGMGDEDVGEVGELVLDDAGKVKDVVLDVGGFLGIGERNVAVPMDQLQIIRNEDGSDLRVYIDATQESLEALPEYEG